MKNLKNSEDRNEKQDSGYGPKHKKVKVCRLSMMIKRGAEFVPNSSGVEGAKTSKDQPNKVKK
ncbi:hypothetical protein BRE01_64820 [Brevibacillus reuszeri]|uniref:Spore protein n=1 Tax=Brevibacillus reuszeri TaxID=54915 RepID=A0ABQ0TY13_9BACL|nr:hypothetical protein [Brevibacillus reuszeri]MED1861768.1 hypothetical protein [Brevibacillus reuszeri]GED72780.1 hypothetical protein BRE01_64820 [Brevibacillus reuszeri]